MSKAVNAIIDIRSLDELALKDSSVHRLNSVVKLMTTFIFIIIVTSFDRYSCMIMLPLIFYPVIVLTLSGIPLKSVLKKLLLIEPFIIFIGILNPIFDKAPVIVGYAVVSQGWVIFGSIIFKNILTVTAVTLLIATTGMNGIAAAMRKLKMPRLFVLQILLTYRYISVLLEEVSRILLAYSLRSKYRVKTGIKFKEWGSLIGQQLLRTFDRAQRVYTAMEIRGFKGEYVNPGCKKLKTADLIFLTGFTMFFIIVRCYNIPEMLGSIWG